MDTTINRRNGWRLSPLILPMLLPLCDPAAEAQTAAAAGAGGGTDPAAIDRAVAAFTGAPAGTPGGARGLSDPRLRLAACAAPLAVSWHTPARTSVAVECAGPAAWRIFVAVSPAPGAAGADPAAAAAAPVVKRGDALTIVVRGRGFSVQQAGEAMEPGGIGQWITVRTSRKGEPLRARIERPGLAVIPAG